MMKGVLRVRDGKKGKVYEVEYVNAKGKQTKLPVQPAQQLFDHAKVVDGDEAEIELTASGQLAKCTVPGKEGAAPAPKNRMQPPRQDSGGYRGGAGARQGMGGNRGNAASGPRHDAVAPYNFIPFDARAVIPAFADEPGRWSGKIVCSLKALTPFLVSGKQQKANDNAPGQCRFMEVDGKPVIPGSSIKGMLRNLLQILSFSNMLPVMEKHLFWRRVDREDYRDNFAKEVICGAFLRKRGTEYFLVKTQVTARELAAPVAKGCKRVKTGGIKYKDKETGQLKDSTAYDFSWPAADAPQIPIKQEIVNTFRAQLTPNQETRWPAKTRAELMREDPGLPVFYREDEATGDIQELGFCRYFRIKYKYTPHDLAYPEGKPVLPDFASRLFGTAGRKNDRKWEIRASKGRVSVQPAFVRGKLHKAEGIKVILGGPKPTCLPIYLIQDLKKVKRMPYAREPRNDISSMVSYNDANARLRGYKLYWHHDVDEAFFPGNNADSKNDKVKSVLYPLAKDSQASIVIHVDRLTDTELGGLLEALDLPADYAHKLGMGKSLGLGSVRLDIEEALLFDASQCHRSLAERLAAAGTHAMPPQKREELRRHFRARILAALQQQCPEDYGHVTDYYALPPIRDLRIMLNYKDRPTPAEVRTMALNSKESHGKVNFGSNAILPGPAAVAKRR